MKKYLKNEFSSLSHVFVATAVGMKKLLDLCIKLRGIWSMFLLFRQWQTAALFPAGLWGGIAIPDHPKYSYNHAEDNMEIQTLFPEEYKP